MNHHYDIICVGAGVVGCAAAKIFGSDGRRVLVLERDLTEPDRIVGELMQPGGMDALKTLGLEDCTEKIDAVSCFGYSIYRDGQYTHVPYPIQSNTDDLKKKIQGKSFHHGRFIQNLRQQAKNTINVTFKQMTVDSLIREDGLEQVIGVRAQEKGKDIQEEFYAPLTIVADGIFSKFRKEFTDTKPDIRSQFVGFIVKNLDLPMINHGFVAITDPSVVLMYQIGSHETRVLVDIPEPVPSNANGDLRRHLQEVVIPQLPKSLQPKLQSYLNDDQQVLRMMPNGFLPPFANQCLGVIVLGDAMNIRHPLTGGGMTVALQDVILLQQLLDRSVIPDLHAHDLVMQAIDCFHWKRKRHAMSINILAMSLYRLFSAGSHPALLQLQQACVDYFNLGGQCLEGPVGLLSGLRREPWTLIYHFFAVAMYAVYQQWCSSGDWPWTSFNKSILLLYTACITIFPYLWSEIKP
ncbi:squalene epoxidase-domain-containing protein [Halteromyces radiatus]|uniref:squalene epoxidase-domain-containing protein n=1 Tax=Halteromyces radiatus TaxID=101107 RepID=UPI002220B659|nr:squalene epoxidase-domain-containing protein [Halteromyces radiatus]KAI8086717.1 squalene epoxidase-domain-containing protein [Halteromyces radiatus]